MNRQQEIDLIYSQYEMISTKNPCTLTREDRYPFADLILKQEFSKRENDLSQVYKKVVLLNSLYSTNIYATFDVALNIYNVTDFMKRVNDGDISLIDDIRRNVISEQEKDFYSFATKYCYHHNTNKYPIYDSFVEDMLIYYLDEEEPTIRYYRSRMKNYDYFKSSVDHLVNLWKLPTCYKYEKLDKYLWTQGKLLANKQ